MNELLDKLSPYKIFNYLFPGVIFVVLAEAFTHFSFIQEDIILGLFLYYFIGLLISRLGSIFLEPFFKLIHFIHFEPYQDFVSASKKDRDILVLSEANNMFRTLSSLFMTLFLLKGYDWLSSRFLVLQQWSMALLIITLLITFCLSYRKQTSFITKRVKASS